MEVKSSKFLFGIFHEIGRLAYALVAWGVGLWGYSLVKADSERIPTHWCAFDPALAAAIGLHEAILLASIQRWTASNARRGKRQTHHRRGRWWMYNSYPAWRRTLPFISESTIRRSLGSLESRRLILSQRPPGGGAKWYSPAYWPSHLTGVVFAVLPGGVQAEQGGVSGWTPTRMESQKPDLQGLEPQHQTPARASLSAQEMGGGVQAPIVTEAVEEQDEHEPYTPLRGTPATPGAMPIPPVPPAPLPTGDEDTEPDAPDWAGVFTAVDSEIRAWLDQDGRRLQAWCEYAPGAGLGGGYVRLRMRDVGSWPPARRVTGSQDGQAYISGELAAFIQH